MAYRVYVPGGLCIALSMRRKQLGRLVGWLANLRLKKSQNALVLIKQRNEAPAVDMA